MRPSRRTVLLGGTAAVAAAAAVPVAMGGLDAFLRRVLARHFGPEVLGIDGIGDFVADYAALAGRGSALKRAGAEAYFAWQGDRVHMIGAAEELEARFLQTILTRSNIIAIHGGAEAPFDYVDPDPWEPACGLYLSALAEETGFG
ncbi:hypothetical protein [Jannaschia sp. W003]|uniref:hypothetical protein n=1 Tax=Jannaschia sp. W003 TaxID=2867012 RepID=UPI0021A5110E|nr:hypothetical protein [Jannaschia sp. W003]UWQ21572.1 hypothetical protein K3554_00625 [Jannaschia sp. W003]